MTNKVSKSGCAKGAKATTARDGGKTTIKKLDPEVLAVVKEEAKRTHRSVDGMIHEIVAQFVQKKIGENNHV